MSNKLFVGGLSWDTTDKSLKEHFEQYGSVLDARVVIDRDTGRSRGFGFVEMSDRIDAEAAIREADGEEIDGRRVRVNAAQDGSGGRDRRGGGGGRDYRSGGDDRDYRGGGGGGDGRDHRGRFGDRDYRNRR